VSESHTPGDTRWLCGRLRVAWLVLLVSVGAGRPAVAADPTPRPTVRVRYQPPVRGPIIDTWRPPATPYGAGNVGIDFDASPGDPVFAAANGVVTFAGRVGTSVFVVIAHDDGVRTTIGFVRSALVPAGALVTRGALMAVAAGPVHFGARRGATYFDPRTLFATQVWLVG
jgi:murein DD-endopeptidase MepM/ murein hydrolase activator NlpD